MKIKLPPITIGYLAPKCHSYLIVLRISSMSEIGRLYVCFCCIFFLCSTAISQSLSFNLGQTQTSTPFRAVYFVPGGSNHVLFTPKRGLAGEIGLEYATKPKSSFYSSFAFYQSGATQEDYRVLSQDPFYPALPHLQCGRAGHAVYNRIN